jgi:benzoylformate decarboxylase/acetolactate synthase-1/2/3 large subunit
VEPRRYGSDLMVEVLTSLGIEFVALNPGATTRGLHESLVHTGNPEMILALHENTAVSIAQGYAKTTGRPMAVMLHDIVGLLNGSMAVFNAWMDQTPVLVLGGSGPADTTIRRPWIDWIHSAKQQSLLVRDYVKWTDEPTSLTAAMHSLIRAHSIATTFPTGPVYVSLDAGLQEMPAQATAPGFAASIRMPAYAGVSAAEDDLERAAEALLAARAPVVIADTAGRSREAFDALRSLAESLGARVIDLGGRHNIDNTHWADATSIKRRALREADAVLLVDPRDATWALSTTDDATRGYDWMVPGDARVHVITGNPLVAATFVDREPASAIVDTVMPADSAVALPRLAALVASRAEDRHRRRAESLRENAEAARGEGGPAAEPKGPITPRLLAELLWDAVREGPWQLANGSLNGWIRRTWQITDWNRSLGRTTGGGLGWGAGAAIGCALTHRHDDTIVIDVQPEGDLLYSASALWTAAHYRLPLLMVVVNNRSYNQDRMHQEMVYRVRQREPYDVSTGIDIGDPDIDFARLAQAQGVEAFGPVSACDDLGATLARAVATVRDQHRPVVVDVVTTRDRD